MQDEGLALWREMAAESLKSLRCRWGRAEPGPVAVMTRRRLKYEAVMNDQPLHLESDAIHLGTLRSVPVVGFDNDYDRYMAAHCTPGDPGRLVSLGTSTKDWPVWEIHPAGDEVVIVLSGKAEFIQDFNGTLKRVVVGPHEAIINPPGVPHTANVLEAFTALYITPCPETTHVPRKAEDAR